MRTDERTVRERERKRVTVMPQKTREKALEVVKRCPFGLSSWARRSVLRELK